MTTEYNQKKRAESLEYLKTRDKYVLDGKFTPTNSVSTNVGTTIRQFITDCNLQTTSGQPNQK